jgi:hypothetical protein
LNKSIVQGNDADSAEDLDSASPLPELDASEATAQSPASSSSSESNKNESKPPLRKYIESFDQKTMRDTATLMSKESASLLDRQTKALWGDVQLLQAEMQKVRLLRPAATHGSMPEL